jgi:hypothetical protein
MEEESVGVRRLCSSPASLHVQTLEAEKKKKKKKGKKKIDFDSDAATTSSLKIGDVLRLNVVLMRSSLTVTKSCLIKTESFSGVQNRLQFAKGQDLRDLFADFFLATFRVFGQCLFFCTLLRVKKNLHKRLQLKGFALSLLVLAAGADHKK